MRRLAIFLMALSVAAAGCAQNAGQIMWWIIILIVISSAFDGCGFIPFRIFGGSGIYYGGK